MRTSAVIELEHVWRIGDTDNRGWTVCTKLLISLIGHNMLLNNASKGVLSREIKVSNHKGTELQEWSP